MKLSVIIPGFNTPERWWRRCIESVLAACRGIDSEVICIDDGSEVCPKFLEEYSVRVIYLDKNVGQAAARNRALEVAQGEYVTFVDSDDEVMPDVYNKCLRALEKYNTDIVLYGVKVVWFNDGLQRFNIPKDEFLGVPDGLAIRKLYDNCLFEYPVNKLYRRAFMLEFGIRFDPGICPGEDTVFNLQFLKHRATWCTVQYEGYVYYRYDGSSLSRYFPNLRYSVIAKANAWAEVLNVTKGGELLSNKTIFNEADLCRSIWLNMWKISTPCTMIDRWKFLGGHPWIGIRPLILEMIFRWIYMWLRQLCYIRPIRRWHIKRMYPNVQEVYCVCSKV